MLIPVILSGGAGTRLWPVSRESHPKPFIKMADGESLLLKTLQRAPLRREAIPSNGKTVLGFRPALPEFGHVLLSRRQLSRGAGAQRAAVSLARRCPKRVVETAWTQKQGMRDNIAHMFCEA